MTAMREHWPEYAIEGVCLGLFMLAAAGMATLLQHPASPFAFAAGAPILRRMAMGTAMGLTAIALIYSPIGRRSGAHMNPAVTLTFYRLGKSSGADAAAYLAAQFAGGFVGVAVADVLLAGLPMHPAVNYVTTVPGHAGIAAAFAAEAFISFGMMTMVLFVSNRPAIAKFTGLFAGVLVASYIVVEAPLSGMSMNPARSFGSAVFAHTVSTLWIYFTAPPLGMLAAAEVFVRVRGLSEVHCAKLNHPASGPCIFRCHYRSAEG